MLIITVSDQTPEGGSNNNSKSHNNNSISSEQRQSKVSDQSPILPFPLLHEEEGSWKKKAPLCQSTKTILQAVLEKSAGKSLGKKICFWPSSSSSSCFSQKCSR